MAKESFEKRQRRRQRYLANKGPPKPKKKDDPDYHIKRKEAKKIANALRYERLKNNPEYIAKRKAYAQRPDRQKAQLERSRKRRLSSEYIKKEKLRHAKYNAREDIKAKAKAKRSTREYKDYHNNLMKKECHQKRLKAQRKRLTEIGYHKSPERKAKAKEYCIKNIEKVRKRKNKYKKSEKGKLMGRKEQVIKRYGHNAHEICELSYQIKRKIKELLDENRQKAS
jgi:hypothetical protein